MPQLAEARRKELDAIVAKMDAAGATAGEVRTIVEDFTRKYSEPAKAAVPTGPSRNDEAMASLREMAGMTEGLSESELDARAASPVGSTAGPAMVGAMAVPAIGANPLMRVAGSPLGYAAIKGGVAASEGKGPLGIALEAGEGAVVGWGLGKIPGARIPPRLLQWLGRGRGAQAAEGAPVVAEAGKVVPIAAQAAPAAAEATAVGGIAPGTTKVADGTIYEWGARGGWRAVGKAPAAAAPIGASTPAAFPKNPAEAAARMRAPKARAPKAEPESSTLEQQLRESVKLTKGQRAQLPNAQKLEAKIVDLRTRQGLSESQIVNVLKEGHGFQNEPGMAKAVVDMVFRAHGLKK